MSSQCETIFSTQIPTRSALMVKASVKLQEISGSKSNYIAYVLKEKEKL